MNKSLYRLSAVQSEALQKLSVQDFRMSDELIGRCISTAISLTWTEEQARDKALKLAAAIKKVLANASLPSHRSQPVSLS